MEAFQGNRYVPYIILSVKAGGDRIESYKGKSCDTFCSVVESCRGESGNGQNISDWALMCKHVDSQRIICDDMDVTNIFGLQM